MKLANLVLHRVLRPILTTDCSIFINVIIFIGDFLAYSLFLILFLNFCVQNTKNTTINENYFNLYFC